MDLRLKEIRKAAGLTQERLAEKVGISKGHLSEIETGKRNANTIRLAAFAAALNCRPGDLFKSPSIDEAAAQLLRELNDVLEALSIDHMRIVLATARALKVKQDGPPKCN